MHPRGRAGKVCSVLLIHKRSEEEAIVAKRLMVLAGMLAVLLVAAVPALARKRAVRTGRQTKFRPAPDTSATLTFDLAVEGEPPADATFFGVVPTEGEYPCHSRTPTASTPAVRTYPNFLRARCRLLARSRCRCRPRWGRPTAERDPAIRPG